MRSRSNHLLLLTLMLLGAAVIVATGVDGPFIESIGDAKPSDWLGFAGGVIGGFMTLAAAAIAWVGLQRQMDQNAALARWREAEAWKEVHSLMLRLYAAALESMDKIDVNDTSAETEADAFIEMMLVPDTLPLYIIDEIDILRPILGPTETLKAVRFVGAVRDFSDNCKTAADNYFGTPTDNAQDLLKLRLAVASCRQSRRRINAVLFGFDPRGHSAASSTIISNPTS